jgi:hypothetical protein
MRATLMFRVGYLDEALPVRGITHLVEHLALHSQAHNTNWWQINARVERFRTLFWISGPPPHITSFLSEVTSSISDLPTDRLDAEKMVLRTEEASGYHGSVKEIASYRFGANGPGLEDYREFGLRWLTPDAIRHWSSERFNANNAAIWLTGDLPGDLRLHLPQGKRFPVPAATPLDRTTPTFYNLGNRSVVLSMLSTGGPAWASDIVVSAMGERMRKRLRYEQSLAYETSVNTYSCGKRLVEIRAFADALVGNAEQAAASMVSIALDLAREGHRPDELETMLSVFRHGRDEPDAGLESLWDAASLEIGLASATASWDEYDAAVEKLTAKQIADYVEAAFRTAMLVIPEGASCSIEGFSRLPAGNGLAITGTRVLTVPSDENPAAIDYSDEGISLTEPGGAVYGMRWGDVAVASWWNDGARGLIALDGTEFHVSPKHWREPDALLEAIRKHVPAQCWVPMDDPTDRPD